jgi:hypothetical protein
MGTASLPKPKDRKLSKDFFLKRNPILAVVSVFLILSSSAGQTGGQSYVIRKGDTLWGLAFKFLGDPFQWPRLWHQNQYIANPNLIYPGNTLVVGDAAGQGSQAAPLHESNPSGASVAAPAPGPQAAASRQDDFFSETKQAIEQSDRQASSLSSRTSSSTKDKSFLSDTLFKLTMRRNGYFTSDFLERMGFLWDKKDEKGLVYPGNAALRKIGNQDLLKRYEQETYQENDEVLIEPFSKAHYRPGDTVDVFHSDGLTKFQGKTVNLVRRIAKATIRSVSGDKVSALLFKAWDVVQSGDRVDTCAHFSSLQIDTVVEPSAPIKGTVFLRIENTEHSYLYQTFIVDKGSKDGVMLGDIFKVTARNNPVFDRLSAMACAVHVDETSSTLVIEKLTASINPGDTVSVAKMIRFK